MLILRDVGSMMTMILLLEFSAVFASLSSQIAVGVPMMTVSQIKLEILALDGMMQTQWDAEVGTLTNSKLLRLVVLAEEALKLIILKDKLRTVLSLLLLQVNSVRMMTQLLMLQTIHAQDGTIKIQMVVEACGIQMYLTQPKLVAFVEGVRQMGTKMNKDLKPQPGQATAKNFLLTKS